MARFTDNPEFIDASKHRNRKIDLRITIDWFNDGQMETIESANDEFIKLDLDRNLEGKIGTSIMDKGTLVLDNSNDDYSPKSIASRFNEEVSEGTYEFNIVPNRPIFVELSINGSDYYPYYYGLISSIDSNYDNSRVSLTIEDEMIKLKNEEPLDKFFIQRPAKEVIKILLDDSEIDFNTNTVDDIPYIINYNFREESSIYSALRKIAQMAWAKFYVFDNELHFINIQDLNENSMSTVDTINDKDFLQNNYSENFSTQDVYSKFSVKANPYKVQEEQVIWTGAETKTNRAENYKGSDINSSDELQLTYTDEEGNTKDTNKIPILEGSVAVKFNDGENDRTYTFNNGIDFINYNTGLIVFTNNNDYPLPADDTTMTVKYQYSLLTLPPIKDGESQEKEMIANHNYPSFDIVNPNNYVKYEPVGGTKTYESGSYSESIDDITFHNEGDRGTETFWTNTVTLDEDAYMLRFTGKLDMKSYDHTFGFLGVKIGVKTDWVDGKIEMYVNGSFHSQIAHIEQDGWSGFDSDKINAGVEGGDEIQFKIIFDRDPSYKSHLKLRDAVLNISTQSTEQANNEVGSVELDWIPMNANQTKLIFRNQGDTPVSVYSTYEDEDRNNIYLLGKPLMRPDNIKAVDKNANATNSFSTKGSELSINNDLIYDENRANRTMRYLYDTYSVPRSKLTIQIKGKPHFMLLDKIHVNRDEADIDNDFIINKISDTFSEKGEWNQTLNLRQARPSDWQYDDSEGVSIIGTPDIETSKEKRPPVVDNLSLSLTPREAGDIPYPAIEATWDSNRYTRFHKIYIKRKNTAEWELINRIEENKYIFDNIYGKGTYYVKIVSEGYNGLKSNFSSSPEDSIFYNGVQAIEEGSISLSEVKSTAKDGTIYSSVLTQWSFPTDEFIKYTDIYIKKSDSSDWKQIASRIDTNYYETDKLVEGTYDFKFVTEDSRGIKSDFKSSPVDSIYIEGKTGLPDKVEWEQIYWGADYIKITWYPHDEKDFDEYELRLDDNFGNNY